MPGGVKKPNRIFGRDGIELSGFDVSVLSKLALVPPSACHPFAGLEESNFGFYPGNDFSYRAGIRQLHSVDLCYPSFCDVGMCVNQARRCCMTVEVDNACAGSIAHEFEHIAVAADTYNDALTDGNGLGYRVVHV